MTQEIDRLNGKIKERCDELDYLKDLVGKL